MDLFPSPAGWWVKQWHHHSTLTTLNTNMLKRQMDPTLRRKRECFMRWTCTDRPGKGRGSQDIHKVVSKTCSTHYLWNTWHKFRYLVTISGFTSKFWVCCHSLGRELRIFTVCCHQHPKKRQRKGVFSNMKQQRKKSRTPFTWEKCPVVLCKIFLGKIKPMVRTTWILLARLEEPTDECV